MKGTAFHRLKRWAQAARRDIVALWLAARDPRVAWYAKVVAAAVAAYALSPVDLIPDFVPVLGYLDDLLVLPLGIVLALKLIPEPVLAELRAKALQQGKPTSWAGFAAVVLTWLGASAVLAWLICEDLATGSRS